MEYESAVKHVYQEISSGQPYFVRNHYDRLMGEIANEERVIKMMVMVRLIVVDKERKKRTAGKAHDAFGIWAIARRSSGEPNSNDYNALLAQLPDPSAWQHDF